MEFLQKLSGGQLNRSRDQDAYLSDLMTLEQSLGGSGTVQRAKIRVDF
jgi:hypothetical protein